MPPPGETEAINVSGAIPIKKRRFPMFRLPSPTPEEHFSCSVSKNKQQFKTASEERLSSVVSRNTVSPCDSDVGKISGLVAKKEFGPSNVFAVQANVDDLSSRFLEAEPTVDLSRLSDLGNKLNILSAGKEGEVKGSKAANVKQEISSGHKIEGAGGLNLSMGSMCVELSFGPKEPVVPSLDICNLSEKSSDEKPVQIDHLVCTNRLFWDLNTTMDKWEVYGNSDALADELAYNGEFGNTDSFEDEKSSLTTTGTIICASDSADQQCKIDINPLCVTHDMPHKEQFSLSKSLISKNACHSLGLQQVHALAVDINRPLKSEPIDEITKLDCSNSSSNAGLLNLGNVKTEFADNHSVERIHFSNSVKSVAVHEGDQEAIKSEDGELPQSISTCTQHEESPASSNYSVPSVRVTSMPQNSCGLISPACLKLKPSVDLSAHSEHSLCGKKELPVSPDDKLFSRPPDKGDSIAVDPDKHKLTRVDEGTNEFDDNNNFNVLSEASEECAESGCGTQTNSAIDNSLDKGGIVRDREDEEYEDGEVREPSCLKSPCKTSSISKRLLTTRSGNERYTDLDQEMQPQGIYADETYTGSGSSKYSKFRTLDQLHRNPRSSFVCGRGGISRRLVSDNDFASGPPYGPSDYRPVRRKNFGDVYPRNTNGKFMRHSPHDIMEPVDDLGPRNRTFSTMQRKGYKRARHKSRSRSPGPWALPYYRTRRRMSSPDQEWSGDGIVYRRRRSPSYGPVRRTNRRVSPERAFLRSGRRVNDRDEYLNRPSTKFQRRRGPNCQFRQGYNGDGENFRFFQTDDGFFSDSDGEFVEKELDGRVEHCRGLSRRIRNVVEQEDKDYGPVERAKPDDGGFGDGRGKRRF
ncbi:protein kinase superfamily protein [Striga asiatica]|uniref:Protein kinase superfamily protein n=1 Tax=Striga asiatica TaxID=4170 RepID=A0A5A7QP62_STRAF|nr:protein kinase superfamily protein [Striga asiatica]